MTDSGENCHVLTKVKVPAILLLGISVLLRVKGKPKLPSSSEHDILGNPGVTHSVPTAFMMNAVGTEWVTPGLPRMGT